MFDAPPPLALYIHLPWCAQKCPYCDFNSYQTEAVPEREYVDALLRDLEVELPLIWGRGIESIFIGGGTPSMFSAAAIERLFSGLRALLNFSPSIEITLESNPGSADAANYAGYAAAGVNRLSIGVQSFDDRKLAALGRIHDADQAQRAFEDARAAGFGNINLDLMYGLPAQSVAESRADLLRALALGPEHISHYQLTIEPNTLFHRRPPDGLPDDDLAWAQQEACLALLAEHGFEHYEVSAHCRPGHASRHNLNYWQFGDYVGIGAGAHGKITLVGENVVLRRIRPRQPRAYLEQAGQAKAIAETRPAPADLGFEFMLGALRLKQGFASHLFRQRTGLSLDRLIPTLQLAAERGLLRYDDTRIVPTELGFDHLNELQALFLTTEAEPRRPIFDTRSEFMHN